MTASGKRRFTLEAGEAMLCEADVRADTPSRAGVLRRVRVTDRRVALCRVPGRLMGWTAFVLVAVPLGAVQTDVALKSCLALLVALIVLRHVLPFRRVERVEPGTALRDVTQAGRALLLWFEDGSMWQLAPSRAIVDLGLGWKRDQEEVLGQALGRLIGRGRDRPGLPT